MPIKVFSCESCGRVIEYFNLSINEKAPEKCDCGGKLKRNYVDNNIGVTFHGTYHNW